MDSQFKEGSALKGVVEVVKLRKHNNQKLWKSRLLSVFTIVLVIVTAAKPAFAQFAPPTTVTQVPCIGFFCNVAARVTGSSLFSPMASVINGLFTIVNLGVATVYMVRGYQIARKIDRNNEGWKQEAQDIGTSLAVIFVTYLISLAFLS